MGNEPNFFELADKVVKKRREKSVQKQHYRFPQFYFCFYASKLKKSIIDIGSWFEVHFDGDSIFHDGLASKII